MCGCSGDRGTRQFISRETGRQGRGCWNGSESRSIESAAAGGDTRGRRGCGNGLISVGRVDPGVVEVRWLPGGPVNVASIFSSKACSFITVVCPAGAFGCLIVGF